MNIFKEIIFVFKNWSKIKTPLDRILSVGDEFALVGNELNKGVKYMNKYQQFEQIKKEIERTAKTPQEYEKRVKALAKKMGL